MPIPSLPMPNGHAMPALGFGTFQLEPNVARRAVATALEVGYRHIDTADMYHNHQAVGDAIAASGVPRNEIYLVTKVWQDRLRHDDVLADADRFLNELSTDYLDQLLIHWPNSDIPMDETFAAFDELVSAGRVRAVGVSNFTEAHLQKAVEASNQPIATNQVEFHPYLYQKDLLEACKRMNIVLVAYRPVVKGEVNDDETLQAIGDKHGKTPIQVTLRWMVDLGIVTIPRSSSDEHIESNFQIGDFQLDADDMRKIESLNRNERRIDPDFAEFAGPR